MSDPHFWAYATSVDTWTPMPLREGQIAALANRGDYERGAAAARAIFYASRHQRPKPPCDESEDA